MENKDLIHKKQIKYMKLAINEAKKAYNKEEVPIGCIIIDKNDNILAKTHNLVEHKHNATYHAEILAINKAMKKTGDKYLIDCSIFITLEPCPMCAMAISLAKISNIYIAAEDKKGGAILNGIKLYETAKNLYKPKIHASILKMESETLLKNFFKIIRNKKVIEKE